MKVNFISGKIKLYQILITLVYISILATSCGDDDKIESAIPKIKLASTILIKDIKGLDSLLILGIEYEDGDGDIGLGSNDTFPPFDRGSEFQYNLIIDLKEIKNNTEQPILQSGASKPENFNQRVPNITPTGKNKSISGVIDIRLDATKNYLYPDSITGSVMLIDRALNKSNVVDIGMIRLTH